MAIQIPTSAAILSGIGRVFKSPWLWAVLLLVGVGGGTYWYLKDDKRDAVEDAENRGAQDANNQANEETRDVENAIEAATDKIIADNARLREQTAKDFERVRGRIETASQQEREAPVAPLIVDTLNELDRLRANRDGDVDAAPVRDANVPAG